MRPSINSKPQQQAISTTLSSRNFPSLMIACQLQEVTLEVAGMQETYWTMPRSAHMMLLSEPCLIEEIYSLKLPQEI
jgi:hypothetical protein